MDVAVTIAIFLCSTFPVSQGQNMHQLLMAIQNMGEGGQNMMGNYGTGMMGGNGAIGGGDGGGGGGTGNCPLSSHAQHDKYTQIVNNRPIVRDCAPGTSFSHVKCACVMSSQNGAGAGRAMGGPRRPGSNPRLQMPKSTGTGADTGVLIDNFMQQYQSGSRGGAGMSGGNRGFMSQPSPPKPKPQMASNPMSILMNLMNNNIAPNQGSRTLNVVKTSTKPLVSPISYNPRPQKPVRKIPAKKSAVAPKPKQVKLPAGLPPEVYAMFAKSQGPPGPAAKVKKSYRKVQAKPSRKPLTPKRNQKNTFIQPKLQKPSFKPHVPAMKTAGQGFGLKTDPMAQLLAQYNNPSMGQTGGLGAKQDPFQALLDGLTGSSNTRNTLKTTLPGITPQLHGNKLPSVKPRLQGNMLPGVNPRLQGAPTASNSMPDIATLMASLGGGGGGMTGGMTGSGGGDMAALAQFAAMTGSSNFQLPSSNAGLFGNMGSSGGGSNTANSNPLNVMSLGGNLRAAAMMGETPGPGMIQNMDMTSYFNVQGKLTSPADMMGGANLMNNMSILKLQQMDREGHIDLGDLTPAGLIAANKYYTAKG